MAIRKWLEAICSSLSWKKLFFGMAAIALLFALVLGQLATLLHERNMDVYNDQLIMLWMAKRCK